MERPSKCRPNPSTTTSPSHPRPNPNRQPPTSPPHRQSPLDRCHDSIFTPTGLDRGRGHYIKTRRRWVVQVLGCLHFSIVLLEPHGGICSRNTYCSPWKRSRVDFARRNISKRQIQRTLPTTPCQEFPNPTSPSRHSPVIPSSPHLRPHRKPQLRHQHKNHRQNGQNQRRSRRNNGSNGKPFARAHKGRPRVLDFTCIQRG